MIGSQHIFIHWAEGFKLKLALVTEFTAETIVAIFVLSVMFTVNGIERPIVCDSESALEAHLSNDPDRKLKIL